MCKCKPDEYWFDKPEVTLREIRQALRVNGLDVYPIEEVEKLRLASRSLGNNREDQK